LQRGLRAALLAALLAAPTLARADDPEAAHQAYDRGKAAFDARRWAEAAGEFARADALAPNPVALESALKAAVLADDPLLAMSLADRAESRSGAGEAVIGAAKKARARFADRTGKLLVRCAAARRCTVNVDADPFPVEQRRWVKAGDHAVEISAEGKVSRYTVKVEGAMTLEWSEPAGAAPEAPPPAPSVAPPAPSVAPPPPAPSVAPPPAPAAAVLPPAAIAPPAATLAAPAPQEGLSPAWFWAGLGLTAVAGGLTIASGVDTLSKHDAFMNGLNEAAESGKAAQTRTNLFLGVTGALGLSTAALGLFAVRWHTASPRAPALVLQPGGATLAGHF
jgi:hypothetical protein